MVFAPFLPSSCSLFRSQSALRFYPFLSGSSECDIQIATGDVFLPPSYCTSPPSLQNSLDWFLLSSSPEIRSIFSLLMFLSRKYSDSISYMHFSESDDSSRCLIRSFFLEMTFADLLYKSVSGRSIDYTPKFQYELVTVFLEL